MYRLLALFFFLGCVCDPTPNQATRANWPWLTQPGQYTTPSYWQGGSGWSNTGREDPRGPGWGSGSSSNGESSGLSSGWGSNLNGGSNGDSGWGSRRCGGNVRRSRCTPSIFDIERQLLGAAQRMMSFCTAYSDRPLREVYGVVHYKLRVTLTEFSENDIQVRVRQRLVTVLASSCSAEYAALRLLPDVVDARRALWEMDGDQLTVLFPYNIIPDTEIQSRCGREFHGDPIIVPKVAAGTQLGEDYDFSFTDAHFREAVKRALQDLAQEHNGHYFP